MENNHYDWCYVSGRVNVLECSLLGSNFFEKLLSTDGFKEVLTSLNNTPLKAFFSHVKHLYEFETLLDDYYYSRLDEIRSLSPDGAVCDFFLIRNDIQNLKLFTKSKALGTSIGKYFRGTMSRDKLDDVWQDKLTALPEVFKESISFIKKVILQHVHNQIPPPVSPPSQGGDEGRGKNELLPFIIDLIFDGAYLRYIEDHCKKIEVEIIKRYLETYQLVKGLEVIQRAISLKLDMQLLDQYFLEGFEQNHLFRKLVMNKVWTSEKKLREAFVGAYCNTPLLEQYFIQMLSLNLFPKISFRYEVATDNYLLDVILPVKRVPFGPERVFGYLCGLTTEVFNLKLALGGKVHKIENNLLRERLRNTYV
ncbi:MAG: V-type ATPase subunit [Planctomycetes bacterium]|nr:V-type ATPase subunit [Planctomycetota bacterium]